ncbi:MAG: class II aldolase/adducin family protein [Pelolinea sp.]|nr:class II aldolase/adducin family protein [Pelolinea sp.]
MPIDRKEAQLRDDICHICAMMYSRGLIRGPSGNVSARLDKDRILLTPGGVMKFDLKPEQLIIVNLDGEKVGPHNDINRDLKPTSELPMHLEVYHRRPDVGGVVHAHTSYVVALTVAGLSLRPQVLTEGMLFLGVVPNAPYGTPTTTELSNSIIEFIPDHDVIILPYHGSITFGHDVWQAFSRTEVLEQVAEIQYLTSQLGGEKQLSKPNIEKMIELRIKYKHNLPSDHKLLEN